MNCLGENSIFVTVILNIRMKKLLLLESIALLLSLLCVYSMDANASFSKETGCIPDETKYHQVDRKKIKTHPKPKPEVFMSAERFSV